MIKKFSLICCLFLMTIGFFSGCTSPDENIDIQQFIVDPSVVNPGEKVVVSWAVIGATSVMINPDIGNVSVIGSKTLVLHETTTFTLSASNDNETASENVTVYVKQTNLSNHIIIDDDAFEEAQRDALDITNVLLNQDNLEITVGYSGGCKNHTFQLISKETFKESEPVQIDVVLSHNAKNDLCEAYLTQTLSFNISALKQKWQNAYQKDSGTIIIDLETYNNTIRYSFGDAQFSFLNVTTHTNKEIYGINETIQVKMFVENLKNESITLEFPDSQVGDFHCKNDSGTIVYLWSYERGFADAITPVTIPAKTRIEIFNESWSPLSNTGELLDAGEYTLHGWLPRFYYQDEDLDYSTMLGPKIMSQPIHLTLV